MPTATFLFGARDVLVAACDWLAAEFRRQGGIHVWCASEAQREQLDAMLWSRIALSFIPHCTTNSPLAPETPVVLATTARGQVARPTLLNLSGAVPEPATETEEIIEIVTLEDPVRQAARERYRRYQSGGYTLRSIDLNARATP